METIMNELQLHLTTEECQFLTELLTTSLKDLHVEEHRTKTPSYREYVIQREDLAQAVLGKVQHVISPATAAAR